MKARHNPYRVEQLHQLQFRFHKESWESLLVRIEASAYRGAIIGPHGSGKTTLLLELNERLQSQGICTNYLRINTETKHQSRRLVESWLQKTKPTAILLLDGAEQLGFFTWRKLKSRSKQFAGLLITAHSAGKLPMLYQTRTDVELLESLIKKLSPATLPTKGELAHLVTKHRGNLRDALRELYDRCEDF